MVVIIYYLLISITSIVLSTINIGIRDWQFWVIVTCIIGANICGQYADE